MPLGYLNYDVQTWLCACVCCVCMCVWEMWTWASEQWYYLIM